MSAQLELTVTRRHIDRGLLSIISGSIYDAGQRDRRHRAMSAPEIARTWCLPPKAVAERVATLIAYGMVVERDGVLVATGHEPGRKPWWAGGES